MSHLPRYEKIPTSTHIFAFSAENGESSSDAVLTWDDYRFSVFTDVSYFFFFFFQTNNLHYRNVEQTSLPDHLSIPAVRFMSYVN